MDYKKDIIIYDLETPAKCFLASFYDLETDSFKDFLINKYQNDIFSLIKYLNDNKKKYFVGYNNLKFDAQVLQYINDKNELWFDKTNEEISLLIHKFSSNEISNTTYGLFNTYKEHEFSFKQIDTPCIWHFFNENKRVSLKQLEFEMRAENIENLEFDLNQDFEKDDINNMIEYCHNDILYTYKHFLFTIGETEHKLYKGKDKIRDRSIVMEEFGIPCLNYDDVKIGAEWNKKDYCEMTKKNPWEISPKKVNYFFGKKYKQFFPDTVEFQTESLKKFVEKIGNTTILNEKQEFLYTFPNNLTICIAKGGIHSQEKYRLIKPEKDEIYLQCDIGSQYPNALRKYKVFPKHLGIEWNNMLQMKIERRLHYKSLYKQTKEPKYNSLQEMGKLSLNGGAYGRLNTKGDWQEDPCCMLQVTMGCQLEILMIVEALILKDFNIISANTDGFDGLFDRNRLTEFFEICSFYEEKIGNKELGNIEYTEFEWIAQTSVNDYLAKKSGEWEKGVFKAHKTKELDDWLKPKGDFEYWKELHKNSSFSIIALAYQNYFDKGLEPELFINNHNNIFDFCARSNSGSTYYHEAYKDNKSFKLSKLIRYYVAKDGVHIKKIVKDEIDTKASDTNVSPADKLKVVCNRLPKEDYEKHLLNIDRKWYIDKVKETIFSIENGRKPKKLKEDKNQLSLF